MKDGKLYLSVMYVYLDVQSYVFFQNVGISMAVMLMELTPFLREYDREHVKLSATEIKGKRNRE